MGLAGHLRQARLGLTGLAGGIGWFTPRIWGYTRGTGGAVSGLELVTPEARVECIQMLFNFRPVCSLLTFKKKWGGYFFFFFFTY